MRPTGWLWRRRESNAGQATFHALLKEAVDASVNNEPEKALLLFDQAEALNSNSAELYFKRGNLLRGIGKSEEAIESYSRAISLDPDYVQALCNRGVVQHSLARHEEALASYESALALDPSDPKSNYNRALLLQERGDWAEAIASYDRAIGSEPGFSDAQYNRSLALLYLGDFGAGWRAYEWRWNCAKRLGIGERRVFDKPLWLGEQSLSGRSLLLYAEGGLGDTIQFCRYATLCAEQGANVILQVQPSLVGLLNTLGGGLRVLPLGADLPPFDFHCPLMSLPLAFRTTVDTIPSMCGYLSADATRVEIWRSRLEVGRRPRVGLAWSGNPNNPIDLRRSIKLSILLEALPNDACYFPLQKDVRPEDRTVLTSADQVMSLADIPGDFEDTAAICACMDAVVSVDTSVAHLAAALGRKVWVPLAKVPDWRWMTTSEGTPWYPTMTLFRQDDPGDWSKPLAQIAVRLRETLDARDAAAPK